MKRILAVGAAAGLALGSASTAVPAWAEPAGPAVPAEASLPATGAGVSAHGLQEAVGRDLGLAPEEFNAAGELGRQAAGVAEALRGFPGYGGIRLQDGAVVVSGSGAELEAMVAGFAAGPAVILEPPATVPLEAAVPVEGTAPPEPAASNRAEQATEQATSTRELFEAYVREVGPRGLQAVAYSDGRYIIRTGGSAAAEALPGTVTPDTVPPGPGASGTVAPGPGPGSGSGPDAGTGPASGTLSAEDFVARFANVELDAGTDLTPEADLVGGLGYVADTWEVCSTGFSAFDPAGLPAVLTAGHCSNDGAARQASLEFPKWTQGGPLGTFGFSQFGGPGNTGIVGDEADPGNVGTDVAVIGSIAPGLEPQPAASTWNDPSQASPEVKIIGTAEPVEGQPVCRSGRTSAWSCGTIDEVGIYVVQGRSADPADLRAFSGFLSFAVQSSGGDSGGPWLSGNYAVGIHAAGEGAGAPVNFAVAASLDDALAVLPGYELELFLNKPAVDFPAPGGTLEPGQAISGNVAAAPATAVAAGSAVRISVAGQAPFEVPVDSAGSWQFTAPATLSGPFAFTAETVNGYSASGASTFEFSAAGAVTPQPPVTEPIPPVAEPQPPVGEPEPAPAPAEPVLTPSTVAPAGSATVVEPPATPRSGSLASTGGRDAYLATTGAGGLLAAAIAAAAAIAVGGFLMVLVRRRRNRSAPRP